MPRDEKVSYIVDNLRNLADDIAEEAVEVLVQAKEIEYAVVLARDKGMIKRAIQILVDEGDYLWAALIAKNAGLQEEAERLYQDGLSFYIDMEMYGRAISAATALMMPQEEIDALFRKGIEVESRGMDLGRSRAMLDSAMESLEISLIGRGDSISQQVREGLAEERKRWAEEEENRDAPGS
jgi:intracellular sulfur oxidation DsrE/DsrF family protein